MTAASASTKVRSLVVAFDFSPGAELAFQRALEIADEHGTIDVAVVCVGGAEGEDVRLELPEKVSTMSLGSARALLKLKAARASEDGARPVTYEVRRGSPGSEIADYAAERSADLVVIGTHGRRGVSRALMGSVAEYVVRHAGCPVLVVREKDHAHRLPGEGD